VNDYWCTYNEHDGCNYVKTGVQELTGQWNPSFWEGDTSCGAGGSSSLYGEKKIYLEDVSYYKIKAQVNIDDNSWVEINGVNVSGLQRVCCGWTSWVDVASSYFKTGWNTVKFRAEDTCSGNRYFDMDWDVKKDDMPPTTTLRILYPETDIEVPEGQWLKAGTYTIKFEYMDNVGGFGLKKCEYYIKACDTMGTNCITPVETATGGLPIVRENCNNWSKDIVVGEYAPPYDLEGMRYFIYSGATDNANQSSADYKRLWFDFTEPWTK